MSTTLCGHRVCSLTDGGFVVCGLAPGHKEDHQPDYIDVRERKPMLPLIFHCRICASVSILNLIVPQEDRCLEEKSKCQKNQGWLAWLKNKR